MCQGDSENLHGINIELDIKMMGNNNNNNNFFTNYNVSPQCHCMNGSRRIRKRHPATVQTPGRVQEMAEGDVMEPLVSYLDRLEPGSLGGSMGSPMGGWQGMGGGAGMGRDFNDNFRCDDKIYETQFVMEFSHLKVSPPRQGGGGVSDEFGAGSSKQSRLMSSTSKLK